MPKSERTYRFGLWLDKVAIFRDLSGILTELQLVPQVCYISGSLNTIKNMPVKRQNVTRRKVSMYCTTEYYQYLFPPAIKWGMIFIFSDNNNM